MDKEYRSKIEKSMDSDYQTFKTYYFKAREILSKMPTCENIHERRIMGVRYLDAVDTMNKYLNWLYNDIAILIDMEGGDEYGI